MRYLFYFKYDNRTEAVRTYFLKQKWNLKELLSLILQKMIEIEMKSFKSIEFKTMSSKVYIMNASRSRSQHFLVWKV